MACIRRENNGCMTKNKRKFSRDRADGVITDRSITKNAWNANDGECESATQIGNQFYKKKKRKKRRERERERERIRKKRRRKVITVESRTWRLLVASLVMALSNFSKTKSKFILGTMSICERVQVQICVNFQSAICNCGSRGSVWRGSCIIKIIKNLSYK